MKKLLLLLILTANAFAGSPIIWGSSGGATVSQSLTSKICFPNASCYDSTAPVGNVTGPASSTGNALARYSSSTGKVLSNSVVTLSDAGTISNAQTINDGTSSALGMNISETTTSNGGGGDYTGIYQLLTDSNNLVSGIVNSAIVTKSGGTGGSLYASYYSLMGQSGTHANSFYNFWADSPGAINATNYYGLYIGGVSTGTMTGDNYAIDVVSGTSHIPNLDQTIVTLNNVGGSNKIGLSAVSNNTGSLPILQSYAVKGTLNEGSTGAGSNNAYPVFGLLSLTGTDTSLGAGVGSQISNASSTAGALKGFTNLVSNSGTIASYDGALLTNAPGTVTGGNYALRTSAGDTSLAGHLITTGTAPAVTACGTSPSISGNDKAGVVTIGTGGTATSCTLTFAVAYTAVPHCFVNDRTEILQVNGTPTTSTLTITKTIAFSASSVIDYMCVQ